MHPLGGANTTIWRFPGPLILAALLALGVSGWLFWDGIFRMWGWWLELPEYSHGILIPPIAAFLVWQQKDRLERVTFDGSWWGLVVLLLGGCALLLGQFATSYTLVEYAYLIALAGLVLSCTGTKAFRYFAVPLFILLFMIPLPQFLLANLSTKLQLLSSGIGVWFIRLFGISVFVEGNVIDLGGYQLEVAEACNGLRYLFPLMTIGFLMACFYKGALWKRVVLFLSSIPITVIMNSIRVGTIGVMVEHWGISMAEGFLHEFQGWAVFMVSVALMLVEISLLNRLGHESGHWRQLFGVELPAPTPRGASIRKRPIPTPFVAACGVLLVFVAIDWLVPRPAETYPARSSLTEMPMNLGPWTGHRGALDGIFVDALKLDDYLLADYADGRGPPVNLYIAYYNSQRKGEAIHSPRSCLPGGGWQLRSFEQRVIPGVMIDGVPLRANRTLIELGNQRELVYYWFQQRGRIITNEFVVKWYLFWDALTRHRTDGALVRFIVALPPAGDVAAADRRLTDFAQRVAPMLPKFVPK
jgi:exosortase D (VPLPA-CTERM-specific)